MKKSVSAALLIAASITTVFVSRPDANSNLFLAAAGPGPASVASPAAGTGSYPAASLEEVAIMNVGLARFEDASAALAFQVPGASAAESAGATPAEEPRAAAASVSSLRMPMPFRTQKDGDRFQGSNCGPATLGMVLEGFGIQHGNAELRLLTHTYQGTVGARTGTALQHMAHVAADFGLEPIGLYERPDGLYRKDGFARWTVEDVRAEVLAGRPVIPLVKFRLVPGHEDSRFRADHYVVIYGVDGDSFLYHDPIYESPWEGAARWMTSEQLATAMAPTLIPRQAVSFAPGSRSPLARFRS